MLLTEEEYREKWCPHVREPMENASDGVVCVANRNTDGAINGVYSRCIASDCSQWRWGWSQEQIDKVKAHNAEAEETFAETYPRPPDEPCGYCGLAGKP